MLDPVQTVGIDAATVYGQIFENLYSYNSQNALEPTLVESHSISPDGKTISISLKNSKFFSDGSPVTSDDVIFSYKNVIRAHGSAVSWAFDDLDGFSEYVASKKERDLNRSFNKKSNTSFEILLRRPFPRLFQVLAAPYFPILKRVKDKNGHRLIGSGAYILKEHSDQLLTLKLGQKPVSRAMPMEIVFKAVKDREEASKLFEKNEVDLVEVDPSQTLADDANYMSFDFLQTVVLYMNVENMKFSKQVDRCNFGDSMADAISSSGYNWQPLGFGLPFIWNLQESTPQKKRRDLEHGDSLKKVDVFISNSVGLFSEIINKVVIKKMRKFGFDVKFFDEPIGELVTRLGRGNFEAAMIGFVPDYLDVDALVAPIVQTNQQFNFSNFSDQRIDALVDVSRGISDKNQRSEIMRDIFKELNDKCPITFLGTQRSIFKISSKWIPSSASGLGIHMTNFSEFRKREP